MGRLGDNLALGHRIAPAFGLVAGLIVMMIYLWFDDPGEMISRRNITATVLEVNDARAADDRDSAIHATGRVRLADGTETRIMLFPPIPAVDDEVPLIEERYENGRRSVVLDRQLWLGN